MLHNVVKYYKVLKTYLTGKFWNVGVETVGEDTSWTERVSNDEVLRIVGEERTLIKTCKERQKKWIGHILRHDGLLKDVIEGRLEQKEKGQEEGSE